MTEKKLNKADKPQSLATQAQAKASRAVDSVEKLIEGTEAGTIWNEIKDKPVQMFALPEQRVSQHATPIPVEPSKLYLLTRASAALPAIELAIGKTYTVELIDKYTVVSRTVVPLTQK